MADNVDRLAVSKWYTYSLMFCNFLQPGKPDDIFTVCYTSGATGEDFYEDVKFIHIVLF